jgi:hypothetical protein
MILFLGAGASKPFEIPVTRDFALEVVESLSKVTGEASDFLNELKSFFGEKFDLEVLLTLLDDLAKENPLEFISPTATQFILNKSNPKDYVMDPKLHKSAASLFTSVIDIMRGKVLTKAREKKDLILQVYDRLFETLTKRSGSSYRTGDSKISIPSGLKWIFTTNYDQCIETYFNERRVDFEDGIERKYASDLYQIDNINKPRRNLTLVKMHGSIDFFKTENGSIVSLQLPFTKRKDIEEKVLPLGIKIEDEVLLYPTEAGTNRKVIESPFSDLYYRFRMSFQADPHMIIIGFSLRDRTISSIIENILVSGIAHNAQIYLIDPKATDIKEMLKQKGFIFLSNIIIPIVNGVDDTELPQILLTSLKD